MFDAELYRNIIIGVLLSGAFWPRLAFACLTILFASHHLFHLL